MEKLAFGTLASKSVVQRIVDSITGAIVEGRLRPGDQIPTEMELSESMGVGRNSVREAIKILEAMGVLDIRRAEGTFVVQGFQNRMLDPLVYGLILEGGPAREVIELRRIFEAGIMQLAVEKATAKDISAIEAAVDKLEREALDPKGTLEALYESDIALHNAIEQAAHNSLVVKMGHVINRLTTPTRRKAVTVFLGRGQERLFVDLHRQLADVIINRDREHMPTAIEDHYQYWIQQFEPENGL